MLTLDSDGKITKIENAFGGFVSINYYDKCIEILQTYGIYWNENMSDDELDKKYKNQAKKYHPDLLTDAQNKDNNEKFQELANAVNTLKKYIKARNARYKRR